MPQFEYPSKFKVADDITIAIAENDPTFIICPLCDKPLCVGYGYQNDDCTKKCIPLQQSTFNGATFCSYGAKSKSNKTIPMCTCSKFDDNRYTTKLLLLLYNYQHRINQLEYELAIKENKL